VRITILIVDDSGLVREGLRAVIEAEDDLEVVGSAGTAHEALAMAAHVDPDVVVLDVRLPDRGGIEICGDIRKVAPAARVLLCSGVADGSTLIEAARAGADGFISKEATNAEIVDAIRRVAQDGSVIGEAAAKAMFQSLGTRAPGADRFASLSPRERDVLALVAEALTNREIGERLHLSEKTVRNHVTSVLRKLGLHHRTEAALFAIPFRTELQRPSET
jgi:two-component system, NarL family, response regulator DevR